MRSMYMCLLLVAYVAALETQATTEKPTQPEVEEEGEAMGYSIPDYNQQQQQQPAYGAPQNGYYQQQPPPYYGPLYAPPNYDMNYCSVHASFPVVGRNSKGRNDKDSSEESSGERHGKLNGRYKRSYGAAPSYSAPSYDAPASYAAPAAYGAASPVGAAPVSNTFGFSNGYGYGAGYGHAHGRRHRSRSYERHSCRFIAVFSQETCQTCCRLASRSANTNAYEITGTIFFFDPKTNGEHGKDPEFQCVCCAPKKY